MTFVTESGFESAQVDANGVRKLTTGQPLEATDWAGAFADGQADGKTGRLSGVLAGGICTASSLNVLIPADTAYFARQVWTTDAQVSKSVSNNATSYLWGCADGQIRTTASEGTLPTDFDATTCCLLCKATALSGVVTIDNTVQWRARYAEPLQRTVVEGADFFAGVMDTLPTAAVGVIGPHSQLQIYDALSIEGRLIVNGKLRIA